MQVHSDGFLYLVLSSTRQILKRPYMPYLQGEEVQLVLLSDADFPFCIKVNKMCKDRKLIRYSTEIEMSQTDAYL